MKAFKLKFKSAMIVGVLVLINAIGFGQTSRALKGDDQIRPYYVNVPKAALADLRQRILATRWPDKETVADRSQGVNLVQIQNLLKYWCTEYDWRKTEAKLNAPPLFVTNIGGLDIQFTYVKSKNPDGLFRSLRPMGGTPIICQRITGSI